MLRPTGARAQGRWSRRPGSAQQRPGTPEPLQQLGDLGHERNKERKICKLRNPPLLRGEAASALGAVDDCAVFVLDTRGRVVDWYRGACLLYGYEPDEIVGRSSSFLHLDEDVAQGAHERELEVALEHGRYEGECWQTGRDGSRFWAHVSVIPIQNHVGELLGFVQATRSREAPASGRGADPADR
jgi:PAS domain S-box-containing protein